jgi:hypothetical protein
MPLKTTARLSSGLLTLVVLCFLLGPGIARAEVQCSQGTPLSYENLAKTECVTLRQQGEEIEARNQHIAEEEQIVTQRHEREAHEQQERESAEANARIEAQHNAELAAIKCRPSEKPVLTGNGAACETAQTAFFECEQREQPKCPSVGELEAQNVAAYRLAHPVSVTTLHVVSVQRPGHTTISPGYTNLRITTNPLAYITITFKAGGQAIPQVYDWGELATGTIQFVGWSCNQPNTTYHYTVEAVGDTGNPMSVHGSFKGVGRRWCAATKRREQAERNERLRRRRQEERHEAEEQDRAIQRFESNCRAEGGTPVTLLTSDGSEPGCRGPEGGLLPVPN